MGYGNSWNSTQNFKGAPSYRTHELSVGWNYGRAINQHLGIITGLYYGLKFKRESYFFYENPNAWSTKEPHVNIRLDMTFSKKHHHAISLPIYLSYDPLIKGFTLGSGVQLRQWIPLRGSTVGVLGGKTELGLSVLVSQEIGSFWIGMEAYRGLTDIHHGISIDPFTGSVTDLRVLHHFVQISIGYALKPRE